MEAGGYKTRKGQTSVGQALILVLFTTILLGFPRPHEATADTASMAPLAHGLDRARRPVLPRVLSASAKARYERIFALQARGAWGEADREIARLHDRLLLGEALAQRYLATDYSPSYGALVAWLHRYSDEPAARAIYALALRRRPAGAKPPPQPVMAALEDGRDGQDRAAADDDWPTLSPRARLVARQIKSLAATAPNRAEALLTGPEAKRLLDKETRIALRSLIAKACVSTGESGALAGASAARQDAWMTPTQQWEAGLTDWRHRYFAAAGRHFEAVAHDAGTSRWLQAAGAFWAARVALRMRQRVAMTYWLRMAAAHPRTLYGLIAARLLGTAPHLDFAAEPFTSLDARVVMGFPAGRRALALIEVGERARAADELKTLVNANNPALLQSLAGLAERAGLAALSLRIAGTLAGSDGRGHDSGLYPVPHWTPEGGFTVDRALLFALMRQESLFVPHVVSDAGAEGLMQLMPATARDMAQRKGLALGNQRVARVTETALVDPEINLTLAQEYVRLLLEDPRIDGNLVLFALAYNGGPATMQRWLGLAKGYRSDPLLFLESVPSRQARIFTKHVLTNYWIYRERLHQSTHDLTALADGKWPTYMALDPEPDEDGRYAEN